MTRRMFQVLIWGALTVCTAAGEVIYQIDDGSAEFTVGIDPGEDMIWLNTFPVEPGGEVIQAISAAFGRPGLSQALNGLPVSALLYEDQNGGSPRDAVLRGRAEGIVTQAHSNAFVHFPIPAVEVHGTLLAAILFRNVTTELKFIASVDRTPPNLTNRSFTGFAVGMDESNLASIPNSQFGTLADFNIVGNLMVRARGQSVPEAMGYWVWALSAFIATRSRGKPRS